jgi:hypothetical protein
MEGETDGVFQKGKLSKGEGDNFVILDIIRVKFYLSVVFENYLHTLKLIK